EERAKVRAMNVAFYEDFVKRAAAGRKKDASAIDAVAQGRVWTGSEALKHGLVDRLGGLEDAVAIAKQRAGIDKAQEVSLAVFPARKGLIETLLERQEENSESALPADLRATLRWLTLLRDGAP